MDPYVIVAGAGLLAGAMNAMVGGGSFITLPALIAAGLPSVIANTSSTVALYPGGAASAWVYRDGLTNVEGLPFVPSLVATLIGGLAGALLFVASDTLLAVNRFVAPFDFAVPAILLTYWSAQALVAGSVAREP